MRGTRPCRSPSGAHVHSSFVLMLPAPNKVATVPNTTNPTKSKIAKKSARVQMRVCTTLRGPLARDVMLPLNLRVAKWWGKASVNIPQKRDVVHRRVCQETRTIGLYHDSQENK